MIIASVCVVGLEIIFQICGRNFTIVLGKWKNFMSGKFYCSGFVRIYMTGNCGKHSFIPVQHGRDHHCICLGTNDVISSDIKF